MISCKETGYYSTPNDIISKMVSLREVHKDHLRILEPGCASAPFLEFLLSQGVKGDYYGIEKDESLVNILQNKEISKKITVFNTDFVLYKTEEKYDLIIGNPPYGIPSNSDHYSYRSNLRSEYKKEIKVWEGMFNIYGCFIYKAIELLDNEGQLLFVVPGTFMVLNDFDKLREFMAREGCTKIYYLGERKFGKAKICVVILSFIKTNKNKFCLELYDEKDSLVVRNDHWLGNIVTFRTDYTDQIEKKSLCNISDIYDVRFSMRKHQAKKYSRKKGIPILTTKNIKEDGTIDYKTSELFIPEDELIHYGSYYNESHIVINMYIFSKNLRAAIDYKNFPWYGDVYHLLKKKNTVFNIRDEIVLEYLRSEECMKYLKEKYRDIIFHLNKRIIENIPIAI